MFSWFFSLVAAFPWRGYAAGAVGVGVLFAFCARTAALRGRKQQDFPRALNALLKTCFFLLFFFPTLWLAPWITGPPLLAYWWLSYVDDVELRGSLDRPWVRDWRVWKALARRFNLRVVRTVDIDPRRQYIFALHPHGILPLGAMISQATTACRMDEVLPGVRCKSLAASFCFYIPFYRDILLSGGVCDASRPSAKRVLDSGVSLYLVPGGATEALHASPDEDVLVLRRRRGFVRLALEHGAALVPVFTFNECDSFEQWSSSSPAVRAVKSTFQAVFGLSLPLLRSPVPRACSMTSVIGAPLDVERVERPSDEQVSALLTRYIAAVEALYATHKDKYNSKPKKLTIV